jgi:hypothetical protein
LTGFVVAMCLSVGAILYGHLPGLSAESGARAFARAWLVPGELCERPRDGLDCQQLAVWPGVPVDDLVLELRGPRGASFGRDRHRGCAVRDWPA